LYIPPPLLYVPLVELPLKVQFISVGLLDLLYIPPPPPNLPLAELPLNVQLVIVGLLFSQ